MRIELSKTSKASNVRYATQKELANHWIKDHKEEVDEIAKKHDFELISAFGTDFYRFLYNGELKGKIASFTSDFETKCVKFRRELDRFEKTINPDNRVAKVDTSMEYKNGKAKITCVYRVLSK